MLTNKNQPMAEVKSEVHPTDIIIVQQVWGQPLVHGVVSIKWMKCVFIQGLTELLTFSNNMLHVDLMK